MYHLAIPLRIKLFALWLIGAVCIAGTLAAQNADSVNSANPAMSLSPSTPLFSETLEEPGASNRLVAKELRPAEGLRRDGAAATNPASREPNRAAKARALAPAATLVRPPARQPNVTMASELRKENNKETKPISKKKVAKKKNLAPAATISRQARKQPQTAKGQAAQQSQTAEIRITPPPPVAPPEKLTPLQKPPKNMAKAAPQETSVAKASSAQPEKQSTQAKTLSAKSTEDRVRPSAAKSDLSLAKIDPARQSEIVRKDPASRPTLAFTTMDGEKKIILADKIWRVREAKVSSEPEGAWVIYHAGGKFYSMDMRGDLLKRIQNDVRLEPLTAPNGNRVYLSAPKIDHVLDSVKGKHHPNAKSVIITPWGSQQVQEPTYRVNDMRDRAGKSH